MSTKRRREYQNETAHNYPLELRPTAETKRVEYESAEWRRLREAGWQSEHIYLPDDGGEVMALMRAPAPRVTRQHYRHQRQDAAVCGAVNGFFITTDPAKVTCPRCLPTARREATARASLEGIAADLEALGPTGSAP